MDMDLISIGFMVAIIIAASAWAKVYMARHGVAADKHGRQQQYQAPPQYIQQAPPQVQSAKPNPAADKALATYERLAREKLEVIKTALAMGYSDVEIEKLDARLEKLIGKDKLEGILRGSSAEAVASADLLDTQLDREIARLKQLKQQ
jgi:hypothetical protein